MERARPSTQRAYALKRTSDVALTSTKGVGHLGVKKVGIGQIKAVCTAPCGQQFA
jgi:hypothetical protein